MKVLLFILSIAVSASSYADSQKTCVNSKTQELISTLNNMNIVLQPYHTEGIVDECKVDLCIERITQEVIADGMILRPELTLDIIDACEVELCVEKEAAKLESLGIILKPYMYAGIQQECTGK